MTDYIPQATERDVFISRSFDAPVAVVWRFWLDPTLLSQWFGPEGITAPVEKIAVDPREGGTWNIVMKDADGEYPITATIAKIVEHEYLEIHLRSDTSAGFLDNEILRVQFHDHGEKTRITLHQGPFTPEFRDLTREGWMSQFLKLDGVLAAA